MLVMSESGECRRSRCCSVLMERWYVPKYVLATFIFLFRANLVRTLAESGYDK